MKIDENTKVTLTVGQLKALVKESGPIREYRESDGGFDYRKQISGGYALRLISRGNEFIGHDGYLYGIDQFAGYNYDEVLFESLDEIYEYAEDGQILGYDVEDVEIVKVSVDISVERVPKRKQLKIR